MSVNQRTLSGLLVTLLTLMALSPIAVQAQPTEASEFYYGVEYDWTSLDSDLQNVTGLDIQEFFSEIMQDADDAGFNIDLGQLTTGASNVYVHQTEDLSVQTVQDLDGNDVNVWSRTSDVVLRHGLLSNAVVMTDWSETTFGSEPTGFDIDIIAEAENVLIVDMLYTEYLNDEYQLIGADMDFDMMISNDMNLGIDVMVEGGGEELNIDFDTGIEFSYSIGSLAEWRLGTASPIYVEAAANDGTNWNCVEHMDHVGVYEEDGTSVNDMCGMLDGTYTGSAEYNVYLSGLPMEEFGFDEGEFDISITDELTNEGDYEGEANMEDVNFNMRSDETLQVDLGDGMMIDATPCDTCPPGNPVMFIMMGNVITHASESFGEAVAEDFEAELEDSFADIFDNIFGEEGDDDAYSDDEDGFMCDDGEEIPNHWVNDGEEDCMDGSDEMDFYLHGSMNEDWESGDLHYGVNGEMNTDALGFETSPTIMCEYDGMYQEMTIDNVNDNWDDCDDGSDEFSNAQTTTYTCHDGTDISFELVNDGSSDCADGSDEPADNEGDWFMCENYDQIPWQYVNDGVANCEDGGDEYDPNDEQTFYCDEYTTTISYELLNDGAVDCNDGSDEGEAIFFMMDVYINDDDGNAVVAAQDLMVCAKWSCDVTVGTGGGDQWISYTSEIMAPSTYGGTSMCAGGQLYGADGTLLEEAPEMCSGARFGPNLWSVQIYEEGDNQLRVFSEAGYGEYDDVTLSWQVMDVTDGANSIVSQGSEAWVVDEKTVSSEEMVDISGPGEYCLEVHLTEDGQSESFEEQRECITVEEGPEVSDKIMTIGEALADSGLQGVLESFGENLGETFEDLAENEVPEFPYVDGMWAPLWSDEHATIVGVGVYAWDEDENGYVIAGPTTTGYSEDRPLTFASIRYITGVPAQEAQQEMAEFDDLSDIVDVENHDLGELEQVLEDAGADTSELGFDTAEGGDTGEDNEEPSPAEEIAEDAGLLPFVSPITVIALIGLAAVAGNRRSENE